MKLDTSTSGRVESEGLSFGPFRLFPAERLLIGADGEIHLGARAFDLLLALVRRAGEVVSKRDLMAEVWGRVTVEEGVLRVHLSGLRKALNDGAEGRRLIVSVPGRGYSFVAPVVCSTGGQSTSAAAGSGADFLPSPRVLVGREAVVGDIETLIGLGRLVTIVGPGGVGKTAVANAVAHRVAQSSLKAVRHVDLTLISDPVLIPSAIAAAIGMESHRFDPDELLAVLKPLAMVLVIDNCEHVISGAATWADRILQHAPGVSMLATSREPLHVSAERVVRLPTLTYPEPGLRVDLGSVDDFSSVRLFLDRLAATGVELATHDDEVASLVGQICRRLDGLPLALELAAGRIGVFGIREVARHLDQRVNMHWEGHRNAPVHQSGLRATLAWSYELLDDVEQRTLRRLATFVGPFGIADLKAFLAFTDPALDEAEGLSLTARLVTKSLLMVEIEGGDPRYRLLETMRGFSIEEAVKAGEARENRRNLARFCCEYLKFSEEITSGEADHLIFHQMGNIRSSLEWAFSDEGEPSIALELAALAGPHFLARSLHREATNWCRLALSINSSEDRDGLIEFKLCASIVRAEVLMGNFRGTPDAEMLDIAQRAVNLAKKHGQERDVAFGRYYLERVQDSFDPLRNKAFPKDGTAQDISACTRGAPLLPHANEAMVAFTQGKFEEAWTRGSRALELCGVLPRGALEANLASEIRSMLVMTRWYRGFPDEAAAAAQSEMAEAYDSGDFARLCNSVGWCGNLYYSLRRWTEVAPYIDRVDELWATYPNNPFRPILRWMRACVEIASGRQTDGLAILLSLREWPGHPQLSMRVGCSLADFYLRQGRPTEAIEALDFAQSAIDQVGYSNMQPEILRQRGEALMQLGPPFHREGIEVLEGGLTAARAVSCLGMELRLAVSLGRALLATNRRREIEGLVAPIYARFTEGFETVDLVAARKLLTLLQEPHLGSLRAPGVSA